MTGPYSVDDETLEMVKEEILRSNKKYRADFISPHEGWAVLKEEVDELWEEVKKRERNWKRIHDEAIQVAAMAVKFATTFRAFKA